MEQSPEPQARQLGLGATDGGFVEATAHTGTNYHAGVVICRKYRLDAMLGEGGMGSVWRATNLQLDCSVAIKLIRDGLDREELRLRLNLEARAAAKLAHSSIVRVFDVGETEKGDPFIVMELLNGETLSQASFDASLSAVRVVQLLLPIAEALSVAHRAGIVHRDLKPDNVFIVEEGGRVQPKLLDFGIAKFAGSGDRAGGLTQSGTLIGTPDYMSPEAARGQADLDDRADVWSFCVVLYEQIAGSLPFLGNNAYAMLRAIVEDAPTPFPFDFAGAADLWGIMQRGLAKNPDDRFQSMAELGRALAIWLTLQGVHDDACGLSLDTKWLRLGASSTLGPRVSARTPASSSAGMRRVRTRPQALWLAIALSALALGGAWSSTGKARLLERAERPAAPSRTAPRSAPSPAAPPALAAAVAETPTPIVAKVEAKPRPLARRVSSSVPVQSPAPSATAPAESRSASASTETRKDARPVALDLIAPY